MSIHGDFISEFDEDGIPIEENTTFTPLSPYLNFDPSLLPPEPEYIYLNGDQKRGLFEHSFYYIGSSCIVGAAIGGCRGFYNGICLTTLAGQTGKIQRTRIINHIMKQGAATSNTLGSIALMYSGLGVIFQCIRKVDDEVNCVSAATLTGAIYRLPGGIIKSIVGGAVGLGLALLYCLNTSPDRWKHTDDKWKFHEIGPALPGPSRWRGGGGGGGGGGRQ